MADTVPVCDVLSEAMEYLSKLGSNLRVRSENLKEKRLRRDKLRNSHAVQKAASKVLLICELSKKSIENVETGVKKILTQIVATQASSDGGKIKSRKSSFTDSDIKYEYFLYKSHNLKIRNKVNLKHFTSVKVLAKSMSTKMQEKYPVFYDCKLYRKRKENKKIYTVESSNNISFIEEIEPENNIPINVIRKVPEHEKKVSDAEDNENETKNSLIIIAESKPKHNNKDTNFKKERKQNKNKKLKHIRCINDSSDSERETEKNPEKVLSEIQEECGTSSKDCTTSKINTADDSIPKTQTTSIISDNIIGSVVRDSILSISDVDKCREDKQGHISLNNNSEVSKKSDSDIDVKKLTLGTDIPSNTINVIDNSNGENIEKEITNKANLQRSETSQSPTDSKPFIKCVNINKLLKDNINVHVIESDSEEEFSVTLKKMHQHNHNPRKPLKAGKKFKGENHRKTNDDKCYWKLKRNEVNNFKAKQFCINVMRLPTLSQEYLFKHNLKKITENGAIICELCKEQSDSGNKINDEIERNIPTMNTTAVATTTTTLSVKRSLLNDSGSDDENSKNVADHLNSGLVIESERNKSNIPDTSEFLENNSLEDTSKSKTPDPITQSNKNDETSKSSQNDEIKSSLLNDSPDENSPNKKRKHESAGSSPPSKRKHIMESMHAKKMLLTYSSSSDTDDEELRDTLKKILTDTTDDENKEDKTIKDQSKSDANFIYFKKQNSRSKSVTSHDETSKDKKVSESESSTKKTSSHTEDNIDENSTSSSKKVRRE